MSWPDISALSQPLTHLSAYGEVYPRDLARAARDWLPLLVEAEWVVPVAEEAYAASSAYLTLGDSPSELERQRQVCFAIPAYRRYLIAVLAQGLVQAGQLEDYHKKLERWITGDLAGLATEINTLLDELEDERGRLVEWKEGDVVARFTKWYDRHSAPANWDRSLLGLSVSPEQLFTAVLSHATAFAATQPRTWCGDKPVALLPSFDMPRDAGGHLLLPEPAPWSTARQSVHSSLRFFDRYGNPLYDGTHPVPVIWQDVLALQPYYRAVLRLAIAVRLSGYGTRALALFVPDELGDARVLIGGRECGTLADLLPHLVEVIGYQAFSRPSSAQVKRILEHWTIAGALEIRGSHVLLREQYAQTLHERRRALELLRGKPGDEQKRLDACLKERA